MTAATWAWVDLVIFINAYWLIYDFVLAKHYGWPTMTGQFQTWLHGAVSGPLIFGATVFVVGAFLWHMLVRASS